MSEFSRAFGLMDRLDELTAERLEPTPFGLVIVHSRLNRVHDLNFLRAEDPGDATAEELAAEAERVQGAAGIAHRRVNIRDEAHGKDETLVQQILEHRRDVSRALPTRLFADEADRRLVAHTELYSYDGVGQVENVMTLEAYRGRGLARALVLHAASESRAAGNDLTFLVADADDWPQRLYERLGFETVGRYSRFLKTR